MEKFTQVKKFQVMDRLKGIIKRLDYIRKEIATMDVPGLLLVREDLETRRTKSKQLVHGQKHNTATKEKTNVTTPSQASGQGTYPQGLHPSHIPSNT